ncbi:thymocyte selection-associated high mobility group box protein TOX-like [Phascolarctos cinereus]|uniref:Thymocyte selection-associated high mobility group box protein TOX-like isoform X1 n=1 Tax=Phascolarctos cinereus TaxID=38626 RepID=A0A6P5LSU1_PHACI|nr:thymocyte selection-associated high mobility group box protein TOX-like isoform X1 [Phascolarctos cinereus]
MQNIQSTEGAQYSSHPLMAAMRPRVQPPDVRQPAMIWHGQLTTTTLSAEVGVNMGRNNVSHNLPSPSGSKSATPSPSSSVHEDEGDDTTMITCGKKWPASDTGNKPKSHKKKKKDSNEPEKPVPSNALFFRDTQAAIKGQNPNATFGEVSNIVASMWDGLGEEQKQIYKRKTEAAKTEYLKQLAAYRTSLVSKSYSKPVNVKTSQPLQGIKCKKSVFHDSTHTHSVFSPSSHSHQQPRVKRQVTAMHPILPRNIAPKPDNQMPATVSAANVTVSPPQLVEMKIDMPLYFFNLLHINDQSTMYYVAPSLCEFELP